jgi:hypothetical protein
MGLQTYTKTHRNFNILSKEADGQFTSRSIVATYTLTPTEYVETTLFHVFVRGQEIRREVMAPPQRLSVTVDAGRVQLRTEQRLAVYEGNRFTATSPASVDFREEVAGRRPPNNRMNLTALRAARCPARYATGDAEMFNG